MMTCTISRRTILGCGLLTAGVLLAACDPGVPVPNGGTTGGHVATSAAATSAAATSGAGGDELTVTSASSGTGGDSSTTSGSGGDSSTSGASTTSSSTGGSSGDCASLPLCDDFEGIAAGKPPNPAKWALVTPDCHGTTVASIDDTVGHSGKSSVKLTGQTGYCNHVFLSNTAAVGKLGKDFYGRYFLRVEKAISPAHATLMALSNKDDGGQNIRMGIWKTILLWNRQSGDQTVPNLGLDSTGVALSVTPAAQDWQCVEFMVKGSTGELATWVNGTEVAGMRQDGMATPGIDDSWIDAAGNYKTSFDITEFKLGWEDYDDKDPPAQPLTLWYDDVALATTRIGCK